jgi:hypothetical protein
VKATNPYGFEVAKGTSITSNGSKAVTGQPTAEELSRLTFAKLRDIRIHTQELRNRFARLLNRGSELE